MIELLRPTFKENKDSTSLKPLIIYLALSGRASLKQDPINYPVEIWQKEGFLVASWDLPFHGKNNRDEKETDPNEAMENWLEHLIKKPASLDEFIEYSRKILATLIEKEHVDPNRIGIAALSRGGFVAAHFMAKEPKIKALVGFSPLTCLSVLENEKRKILLEEVESIELSRQNIKENLIKRPLRLYIGNNDKRVKTQSCIDLFLELIAYAEEQEMRPPPIELRIYQSIGHRGHGTPNEIFEEGARWLQNQLN